jgi:hypothetical protein
MTDDERARTRLVPAGQPIPTDQHVWLQRVRRMYHRMSPAQRYHLNAMLDKRDRSGVYDPDKTQIMSPERVERVQKAIKLKQQLKQRREKAKNEKKPLEESIQKTIKVKILKSK